jgi:peptidyl-prolyl cis-trans isomerase D
MISWMQKHRKYLVITIWISTIAFVGAGFVGWGAYKFGSGSNAVAEVGDTPITFKELQNRYSMLYNYYNNLFKGNFDQQKAKEAQLEKIALNELIQETLLINYAKDHGLIVSDEEIAKEIASMNIFFDKNQQFSKKVYLEVLKNNRLKPKDFEESIKRELLIKKIKQALEPKVFELEKNTIASSLFIGDKLKYKILSDEDISVKIEEDRLKEFYRQHKDNYMTQNRYKIEVLEVDPFKNSQIDEKELKQFYEKNRIKYKNNEGKILTFEDAKEEVKKDYQIKKGKKEALKEYIAFKKGKIKGKEITIEEDNSTFSDSLLQLIKEAKEMKTLKPKLINDKYLIVKVLEKIAPQPMEFKEAYELVKNDYISFKRKELLLKKANDMVNNFDGNVTKGYICQDDVDKIEGVDKFEGAKFLKELFISDKKRGFVEIGEHKVVLYDILEQKLKMENKWQVYKKLISENSNKLKAKLQNDKLIEKLEKLNIYQIRIYKGI